MNIYLVRHGETEHNKNKVHQLSSTPLSAHGTQIVKKTAPFFSDLNITTIYSSHLLRARQTADIIANVVEVPVTLSAGLDEIRKPSEIAGRGHHEEEVVKIKLAIRDNFHDEQWHFSDEENFADVKKRTKEFMQSLTILDQSANILIVTHGYVAKMFLALAILHEDLTPHIYLKFYEHTKSSNVSISKFEYSTSDGWQVVGWNQTDFLN